MAVRAGCCCSTYFYPRPPRGGRLQRARQRPARFFISIHALREEGDSFTTRRSAWSTNFYPRPPRGGRPLACRHLVLGVRFLSTPSARRATRAEKAAEAAREISIHALREEGDFSSHMDANRALNFYPRPPRGGRRDRHSKFKSITRFLSTPSARRATLCGRIRNQKDIRFLSTPSARRATPAQ